MSQLVDYVIRYGVTLVALNVFAEQLGAPIPAVPSLVVAGALTRTGQMSSTHVLTAAVIASVIADLIWFELGRRFGYRILKILCRVSLSPDSCVRDTEARFERWGLKSLLIAKFIPGFSTVAPPLAGAARQSRLAFIIYDGIGALLWAGSAVAAGRIFYRAIDRVLLALENLGWWALLLVGSALAIVIVVKWMQRVQFLKQLRLARIAPSDLKGLIDSGASPVVVDVRSPAARKRDRRRIPTAIVAHADSIEQDLSGLAPETEIVLYCT
ncbi:MAG: VTT domain-containing protein [Acidobacteriota bacterium]